MGIKFKKQELDNKIKKHRKSLSLEEKIKLFEEYMEKTGQSITNTTIYKGVTIGLMLEQLKNNIISGKAEIDEEAIERLIRDGLLDDNRETIGDKITRLERYCKNNVQLWHLRAVLFSKYLGVSEKEFLDPKYLADEPDVLRFLRDYQITPVLIEEKLNSGDLSIALVISELKSAALDYRYISDRKDNGTLKDEYVDRIKEAGITGIFDDKTEIDELSEQTEIPKSRLNKIVRDFGSIAAFRKLYIRFIQAVNEEKDISKVSFATISKDKDFIIRVFGNIDRFIAFKKHFLYLARNNKIITFFNLNAMGFIPTNTELSLGNAVGAERVLGKFFNEEEYDNKEKTLDSNERQVLSYLTATNSPKTLSEIGDELGVSRTKVMMLRNNAIKKLLSDEDGMVWESISSRIRRKRFIAKYFKNKDIFITPNSYELSDELRDELLKVIGYELVDISGAEIKSHELDAELEELIIDLKEAYAELSKDTENKKTNEIQREFEEIVE